MMPYFLFEIGQCWHNKMVESHTLLFYAAEIYLTCLHVTTKFVSQKKFIALPTVSQKVVFDMCLQAIVNLKIISSSWQDQSTRY